MVLLIWPLVAGAQCLSGDCQGGNGVFIFPTGERYVGHFKYGKPDGLGTYFYADGSRYYGYWQAGMPHGAGEKTWSNGRILRGKWAYGSLKKENPQIRIQPGSADWGPELVCLSGDCHEGNGIKIYPDGTVYSGDFQRGRRTGIGICYYPGKIVYRGQWKNDLPHGTGTMANADGQEQSGFWENGKLIQAEGPTDPARLAQAPEKEEKCLSGNCYNGLGVYQSADGRRYEGPFKQGKPHGKGIYYFPNGERYEGFMQAGYLHGKGVLYYPDGRQIAGFWEHGQYVQSLDLANLAPGPNRTAAEPEVRIWAVVVGIAAYDHMPALRFTDDDAYRFYAFLKSPEGGALPDEQVRILIDESATREQIIRSMREVFGKAGEQDLIMLYFSGHGIPGAFLPIDYDGLNRKLFHQEISAILAQSKAKYKVCIADACHSGGLLALRSPQRMGQQMLSFYRNLAQSSPGTALIMSSKSDETSLEASGLRHGVFSHFLIRGLKGEADQNTDRIVGIRELYDFIYREVRAYTGNLQSPVIRGNYDPNMPVAQVRE